MNRCGPTFSVPGWSSAGSAGCSSRRRPPGGESAQSHYRRRRLSRPAPGPRRTPLCAPLLVCRFTVTGHLQTLPGLKSERKALQHCPESPSPPLATRRPSDVGLGGSHGPLATVWELRTHTLGAVTRKVFLHHRVTCPRGNEGAPDLSHRDQSPGRNGGWKETPQRVVCQVLPHLGSKRRDPCLPAGSGDTDGGMQRGTPGGFSNLRHGLVK